MFPQDLIDESRRLIDRLRDRGLRIATAESCTGGLLAAVITAVPGASDVFERGFVTYSNDAKHELIEVSRATLQTYGAVSAQTAVEMARGAIRHSHADLAVSVTGIAGPSGGTAERPVGLVFLAIAERSGHCEPHRHLFPDNGRDGVRLASVRAALQLFEDATA